MALKDSRKRRLRALLCPRGVVRSSVDKASQIPANQPDSDHIMMQFVPRRRARLGLAEVSIRTSVPKQRTYRRPPTLMLGAASRTTEKGGLSAAL
jgi:hypothetical protein